MKISKSKSKGFTLIELLVVVAIISLLSSIVLASLKDARKKAQESAYRSYLKQLIVALDLYRSDNGQYPNIGSDTLIRNLTAGPLDGYIINQEPGNLLLIDPTSITYTTTNSNLGHNSCGGIKEAPYVATINEPYIIYFRSDSAMKNIPQFYWHNGSYAAQGWNNYHCVSLRNS